MRRPKSLGLGDAGIEMSEFGEYLRISNIDVRDFGKDSFSMMWMG